MKVLVIEDHPLTRLGARLMIEGLLTGAQIDEATYLAQALQYAITYDYDLILMDPGLPDSSTLSGVRVVLEHCPSAIVIVVSGSETSNAMSEALSAGAHGFISKAMSVHDYRDAVLAVLHRVRPRWISDAVVSAKPGSPLIANEMQNGHDWELSQSASPQGSSGPAFSPRQRAVLPLLAAGQSNKEIGRALGLQENTVKQHVREILRRMNVRNRTEAAIAARSILSGPDVSISQE